MFLEIRRIGESDAMISHQERLGADDKPGRLVPVRVSKPNRAGVLPQTCRDRRENYESRSKEFLQRHNA
jgi:hypothetical protein